ncbi:MAG: hypothetical protein WBM40_06005 [Thiohalocapsa sp.]
MLTRIRTRLIKWLSRGALFLALLAMVLLGARVYVVQSGPPLKAWHTFVPNELTADELDAADWDAYLQAEQAIVEDMRAEVSQALEPEDRVPYNRYFDGSPVYPANLSRDWNRSYLAEPDGPIGWC